MWISLLAGCVCRGSPRKSDVTCNGSVFFYCCTTPVAPPCVGVRRGNSWTEHVSRSHRLICTCVRVVGVVSSSRTRSGRNGHVKLVVGFCGWFGCLPMCFFLRFDPAWLFGSFLFICRCRCCVVRGRFCLFRATISSTTVFARSSASSVVGCGGGLRFFATPVPRHMLLFVSPFWVWRFVLCGKNEFVCVCLFVTKR